jgi:hypothetical protein
LAKKANTSFHQIGPVLSEELMIRNFHPTGLRTVVPGQNLIWRIQSADDKPTHLLKGKLAGDRQRLDR